MKKLNLGSGLDYLPEWINVETREGIKKDIEWDLDILPYPFEDNTFDVVLIKHVLEHLRDPIEVLREIIRISKNGGKVKVMVPHASSYAAITDIQHKTLFTENSFDEPLLQEYELEQLKLIDKDFGWDNKWKRYIPFKKVLKIFFNGIYEEVAFTFEVRK